MNVTFIGRAIHAIEKRAGTEEEEEKEETNQLAMPKRESATSSIAVRLVQGRLRQIDLKGIQYVKVCLNCKTGFDVERPLNEATAYIC
jgi:hypothetical protein